jgi:hypothetical protein
MTRASLLWPWEVVAQQQAATKLHVPYVAVGI